MLLKINILEELKVTDRNYVAKIKYQNETLILKSPRNEHRIPQRKFFTLFKDGESLSTLKNINLLIQLSEDTRIQL